MVCCTCAAVAAAAPCLPNSPCFAGRHSAPTCLWTLGQLGVLPTAACSFPVCQAELYKLLLYRPGDFFLPHKDTEKEQASRAGAQAASLLRATLGEQRLHAAVQWLRTLLLTVVAPASCCSAGHGGNAGHHAALSLRGKPHAQWRHIAATQGARCCAMCTASAGSSSACSLGQVPACCCLQGGELRVRHQGQQRCFFLGGSPAAASKCTFAAFYAGARTDWS